VRRFFVPSRAVNIASPLARAPGGKSPISASDSIVFPLPDSPHQSDASPDSNRSETSFTGRIYPAGVGSSTTNPRNSISADIDPS